jgi:hypothetical protein
MSNRRRGLGVADNLRAMLDTNLSKRKLDAVVYLVQRRDEWMPRRSAQAIARALDDVAKRAAHYSRKIRQEGRQG